MGSFEKKTGIPPFLWFDTNAEEAGAFYLSVFKNSPRLDIEPNLNNPGAPNKILTISFEFDTQSSLL